MGATYPTAPSPPLGQQVSNSSAPPLPTPAIGRSFSKKLCFYRQNEISAAGPMEFPTERGPTLACSIPFIPTGFYCLFLLSIFLEQYQQKRRGEGAYSKGAAGDFSGA
jgi:hypothetical protein